MDSGRLMNPLHKWRRINLNNNTYIHPKPHIHVKNLLFGNINTRLSMYYSHLCKGPHRDFDYWPPNRRGRLRGGGLNSQSLVVSYPFRSPTTNTICTENRIE